LNKLEVDAADENAAVEVAPLTLATNRHTGIAQFSGSHFFNCVGKLRREPV
jgi:hypothetical protein